MSEVKTVSLQRYGKSSLITSQLKEWIAEQVKNGHSVVLNDHDSQLGEKIHALNELNLDQSFVTTKRELLEKLK